MAVWHEKTENKLNSESLRLEAVRRQREAIRAQRESKKREECQIFAEEAKERIEDISMKQRQRAAKREASI